MWWREPIDKVYRTVRCRQFRTILKSAYCLYHVRPPVLPSFLLSTCLSICPPVCLSAYIGAVHTERIYVKFDIGCFHKNLSRRIKFDWNRRKIFENLYENQSNLYENQSNLYENQSNLCENQSNLYENQSNFYNCRLNSMVIKGIFSNAMVIGC